MVVWRSGCFVDTFPRQSLLLSSAPWFFVWVLAGCCSFGLRAFLAGSWWWSASGGALYAGGAVLAGCSLLARPVGRAPARPLSPSSAGSPSCSLRNGRAFFALRVVASLLGCFVCVCGVQGSALCILVAVMGVINLTSGLWPFI